LRVSGSGGEVSAVDENIWDPLFDDEEEDDW
jgi:hypothetical protein